jgi:Na+/H+ antiporter NhaD/arsenite permease-like protein
MNTLHNTGMTLEMGIALGIFILAYGLIFSEVIHRTSAALMGAVLMVGVGTWLGFYSQQSALEHIDANTLLLLMGMMLIITMLRPTGGFEYLAIRIAKLAGGSPLRLLVYLCLAVSLISMFLDNVTTVLIFAPLTVLITRMLKLNPLPYLMTEAIMSNIGGIATLIGDPPNLMIGSAAGLNFNAFLIHLAPVVAMVWIVAMTSVVLLFPAHFGKGAATFGKLALDESKAIKQPRRLAELLLALGIVIALFFVHHHFHLYPAYVAFIGVAIALPLIRPHPEELFGHVEWSVLVFFAGLFVIVGGLETSGLLHLVGQQLAGLARDPEKLLLTALALMWLSALVSAVVDNIPFTVTMIPIVQSLEAHGVNILPLWWALALGAGLGGNGTHIGATANIICVTESEHANIPEARITPLIWLRKGLPVTLATLIVSSVIFAAFFSFFSGQK